ncbi:MAG: hypothetical protein ACK4NC_04770 [Candidatus Gracilibacteria bacterium]
MEKERFEEQARRAKEFYDKAALAERIENVTNSSEELKIMSEKIKKYNNIENSIFLHLGAGTGRFVNELDKLFKPKGSVAIDIADGYFEKLKNEFKLNSSIEIKHESFFNTDFHKFVGEQLFVFMNWTVLSEVGSKEGLEYLLTEINKFDKKKIIIGDLPFQEEYMDAILDYASKFRIELDNLGVLEFIWGKDNKHLLYLPNKNQLKEICEKQSFIPQEFIDYHAQNNQKRYIFELVNTL